VSIYVYAYEVLLGSLPAICAVAVEAVVTQERAHKIAFDIPDHDGVGVGVNVGVDVGATVC
jgi:hypothetical protein